MSAPTDPTLTELFASVQRTLAESIRVQREATERIVALKLRVATLVAENARLRDQLHAIGALGFVPKKGAHA